MRTVVPLAALAVALAAGCALDEVPEEPSWQVDVMPILAANCVRCHGHPSLGGAPLGFRLDAYGDTVLAAGNAMINGASPQALEIWKRTRANVPAGKLAMPLGRRLGEREALVLRNWAGLVDGSMVAPRGPGRADNATPALVITEVGRAAGVITFAYELTDADRDLVVGSVRGPRRNPEGQLAVGVIGDLAAGRGTFTWDTTMVPAGSHALTARLDDGADLDGPEGSVDYVEVEAATVMLP